MAKLTDLPAELIVEIMQYLFVLYSPSLKDNIGVSLNKGGRVSFFNAREVNRAFRAAAATTTFLKQRIGRWSMYDNLQTSRQIALDREHAKAQDLLPALVPSEGGRTSNSEYQWLITSIRFQHKCIILNGKVHHELKSSS